MSTFCDSLHGANAGTGVGDFGCTYPEKSDNILDPHYLRANGKATERLHGICE